jgi:hypothetical protein
MGQLTRDCPHCHTKAVSFTSYAQVMKPNTRIFVTPFFCGNCYGGYVVEIEARANPPAHDLKGNIELSPHHSVLKEYPLPHATASPEYLPNNIDKFFLQSANSLKAGNFDASSMMSRKVLEVAVKTLNPEGSGNLYKRIEQLSDLGKITEELKDWAHIIRDDGNEAAHEEEPVTLEFANELLSFTEMFLMYTFTMPGMVASRRSDEHVEGDEA